MLLYFTKKIPIILLLLTLGLFLILSYVQAIGQAYRVKDINPGSAHSVPNPLFELNGTIYFKADDGNNGTELWKSDGTEAGTLMVKNINPHTNDPNNGNAGPDYFTELNNYLYFAANDGDSGWKLWKSDGTETGTELVTNSGPGSVKSIVNINGILYFSGYDSTHGSELWKSDGTATGTVFVKDINPSSANRGDSNPSNFIETNGNIIFIAYDGTNGTELWKTDGTLTGTVIVTDINPYGSSIPSLWKSAKMNGDIFFSADDGSTGRELWKSDGTSVGTSLVKDINPTGNSYPHGLTNVNGVLYFITSGCDGWSKLWKSDGTTDGTVMVKEISSINSCNENCLDGDDCLPEGLAGIGEIFYFVTDDGVNGSELWKSDGTITGTMLVKDINPGSDDAFGWEFLVTAVDGILYFAANDDTSLYQLWQSDGTPEGTIRLTNINPPDGALPGFKLIKMNDTLFFRAVDEEGGDELWALPLETNPDGTNVIIYLPIIIK